MAWGSNTRTAYITLKETPQSVRTLMPIFCECGRMVTSWLFDSYSEAVACPHCGGNIANSKELEPITAFYHRIPHVGEIVKDEVTGANQQSTMRQFSQILCNWEDEGRGNCHGGLCEWQDPLWTLVAERDQYREDKRTNTRYPAHFPVTPQHLMIVYSYDKKGPAIFKFGNQMKGELEKVFRSKGRLAGRDLVIYKQKSGNQTKHIGTPADPSVLEIDRDSFDEGILNEMVEAMKSREEPPDKEKILLYLKGEIKTLSGGRQEIAKIALPGAAPSASMGPIPIDPTKPMVGVTPSAPAAALPTGSAPVDAGSTSDAAQVKIPFGKHKGKTLGAILQEDQPYVAWVAKNMIKDHPDVATAATILLGSGSQDSTTGQPSTSLTTGDTSPSMSPETTAPPNQPETPAAPPPDNTPSEPPADTPKESVEAAVTPAADGTYPEDLKDACNNILTSEPKWKDSDTLKALLDDVGEGLDGFDKYQITNWDNDRLMKLYDKLMGRAQ